MKNFMILAVSTVLVSGCATFVKGGEEYLSEDYYLKREAELQKAYDACLKRTGNDEAKCKPEKDELLQQQEWNEMEESG
ncbi:hypothetical protein SAMN02949497_4628 [Methylomagnum ishizawai]|uniref:Uncharacterized protein n=1 Tax=Methylomagnum ishizawai TaxID=1760988 RepID=A0A1Y6D2N6_9GAMM|nr:hypothetical protein [Methylomagnum ishizawai]SMF97209.1 hypothetical protein SAMN02949497_4628 [Methylomagnum ishizawai]